MATGVKPLNGGIQNWLLQRLERLIKEFPGFPTLVFGLTVFILLIPIEMHHVFLFLTFLDAYLSKNAQDGTTI